MTPVTPSLRFEKALYRQGVTSIVAVDEVGRGALAGPVAVGMVVIDTAVKRIPLGLRDSKLLSEPAREALEPACRRWSLFHAVGLASADEVDRHGIMRCLGLAGARAFAVLEEQGAPVHDSALILDGNYDYLTLALTRPARVVTRVKADRDCASVAAASVIAKVHRDRLMIEHDADDPGYGWASNKGYSTPGHFAAIAELGPSAIHRLTWLKDGGRARHSDLTPGPA
ncbi:ribonuclease HII [Leifsonia xyli subsp. xyli]|uniref:Ribonuclease n=3 Tax=Leifsonia xyli TaxID=1575 RepID=Q6AEA6_LEIXX|nr:ribonuclease HII [Leifsonia xyli subsp. xyli str. CTCB07]ODA89923.1 ribonuclease HII [Leifsonia xyli subsp. xyli]